MGRLVPWAKYQAEWRAIRDERKRPRAAKSGWFSGHISSWMSLSRKPRPYCDQTQSLMFRLPPEVRHTVWTYVVGGHDVKIVRKVTKLGHVILPRDQERLDNAVKVSTDPSWVKVIGGYEKRYKAHEVLAEENLLPLLQTSKRVYQEALAAVYAQNRFEFSTMEAFHRFLLRSPTAGLQCMSQLKIHWGGFAYWPWYETYQGQQALEHNESWADICSTIAAMGGLRELTIRGWLRRDRNDRFEFPNLDDYDTLVKVVAPLGGLDEPGELPVIIREDATLVQQYQDRLHSEGYPNIQLVGCRSASS